MSSKDTELETLPALRFIKDQAAEEDGFGSHTRVATAIATVIQNQADIRVIGLLGPWGSGKSTVVKLVAKLLAQNSSRGSGSPEILCFSYDAWLHQNDPPRRSFLETLVHFLAKEVKPDGEAREKWKAGLDRLNGRLEEWETSKTPTLTTSGRILAFSLFLLPLGSQFVRYDWFHHSPPDTSFIGRWAFPFGLILLLLPLLCSLSIYAWWRPRIAPWKRDFWLTHRAPYEDESLLSLVTKKETEKTRHRTLRTPDPTTIEFQDLFREIMDSVGQRNFRLIFIIDNLDRLPEKEAVAMWSTIRSFFLGATETDHVRQTTNLPTIILPVDEHAVERMYREVTKDSDEAQALAISFMDKTFDLTFRVAPPVLSDWSGYLAKQMIFVFGQSFVEGWQYIVIGFFEVHRAEAKGKTIPITPRTINTLVNSIATLWMQWHSMGIDFCSIAYYVVFRSEVDGDILSSVKNSRGRLSELDPNWKQSIAGLHYGVPPEKALQILIEPEIQKAIATKNFSAIKEIEDVPGFSLVLLNILEEASKQDGINCDYIFSSALLLNELKLDSSILQADAWRFLNRGLERTAKWRTIEGATGEALRVLGCHSKQKDAFISTVTHQSVI